MKTLPCARKKNRASTKAETVNMVTGKPKQVWAQTASTEVHSDARGFRRRAVHSDTTTAPTAVHSLAPVLRVLQRSIGSQAWR